jgi:hypothetical protein
MCLGVESFALVLNEMFGMLGWIWMRWLGVFIALNHFHSRWGGCWRWAHRTGTVPCPVRRYITQPLGFGAGDHWRLCPLVAPDSPVPHRTVRCPLWLSCSDSATHCSLLQRLLQSTVAADSRCSADSPDSPVAHRIVQWIIAKLALEFPRVAGLKVYAVVHRTLSGGTPDSPVRHSSAHSSPFAPLKLCP